MKRGEKVPLAPLEAATNLGASALAEACGVARYAIYRWRSEGLPIYRADTLAVRAGFHPCEVWPEFFGVGADT